MIRILLLDDEPNILTALKRLLREEDWLIDTFTRAEEALDALQAHRYGVIVSDYQMPGMDGVTYLQFARQRQPDAIRLILSAHGDRQSMINAINRAEIYRFLSKPWEDYEIQAAIRSAVDLYRVKVENRELLAEIHRQKDLLRLREEELMRLETENPGITRVARDADGSIIIDESA
ncbi:Response regulator receiver domain-containing protein [Marinobacter daqiaonensis]|uniref:Response regulator receiver domain-containing protein n=1 Tax=Marinobacter daqiaonensis TaxID=650891 RepID=A0A1I6IKR6_9GAMM|nr:response regulator [Marinobacter daqiaonensis]SFR67274.1 Response regulator receiver domain-containing protein [Marinobacter daqiaonensis]